MSQFRITSNSFNNSLDSQLRRLNTSQLELMRQVTTGQKITRPSDDPSAMTRVLEMQQEKREVGQYHRNISKAKDISNVTYSRIEKLQAILTRAQEIASLTNSDLSPENFKPYSKELDGMVETAVQLLNGEYLDERLFSAASTGTDPVNVTRDGTTNKITALTYQGGTGASPQFYISDKVQMAPRTSSADNQELMGVAANLISLRDALESENSAQVRALEPTLRADEDRVIGQMGKVSANLMRINFAERDNASRFTELDGRISREADVDLGTTIMKLSQVQTALQAAMQGGARIMSQSILNYL